MPAITRQGDSDTGHDACPGTPLSRGSPNVNINGKAAGRVGDSYVPHGCDIHAPHSGVIASGSATVFINGKAAGRVGDLVSCGGSVATGSPNVFIGNGGGEATSNCVKSSVLKTLSWEDANEIDRTILSLPEIAKNMANKSESGLDEIGWNYLAEMFEKWLAKDAEELNTDDSAFIIDYDWLVSYGAIRYFHNDLEQSAFNEAAQNYFSSQIKKYFKGQTEFDCRESYESNAPIYCNSRAIADGVWYNYFTAEGVYVCLAAFMLYALPKGTIHQIDNNKYRITVEEIYLGAFDSFNFEGDQDYLFWSYKDKDFSKLSVFNDNYKYLKNEHFRAFKRTYNRGKDFYVKTNLHKVVNFTPVTFEIELN
jgi:uncharacterized Zn-binding protein involved in type VI secretion